MVQPGGVTAYEFSSKHVSAAVDLHHAQLREELQRLNPEGLRALDLEHTAAMERMNIVPEEAEVRTQMAECVAKSLAARRMGETYDAARYMHDGALVYLRAQWWLDARKALAKCKELLQAHVAKHGSKKLLDDLSGYTALHHAVYTNAATVEHRLDPIINRERAARTALLDGMQQARAMPPSCARAQRMRLLKASVKAECATLTKTQSWEAVIHMQQNLIFLEYDIASFEDTMGDLAVVRCIDECVSLVESILFAHKDSINPARYDAHLKLFREFRSVLDQDGRVDRPAARVQRLDPILINRERAALAALSDRIEEARAMPPSDARARRMRRLKASVKAECAVLTKTESWEAVIHMQQNLIFFEKDIASFEDTMGHPAVVRCIDECVSLVESILLAHKDSIDPDRYDAHLKLFRKFRSDLDQHVRVHRLAGPD
jgi:hypothetical protein